MDYSWLINQWYIIVFVVALLVYVGSKGGSFRNAERNIYQNKWRNDVRKETT